MLRCDRWARAKQYMGRRLRDALIQRIDLVHALSGQLHGRLRGGLRRKGRRRRQRVLPASVGSRAGVVHVEGGQAAASPLGALRMAAEAELLGSLVALLG